MWARSAQLRAPTLALALPRPLSQGLSAALPRARALHTGGSGSGSASERFWKWTTQERPFWMKDWKEGIIACVVFGITGTSSMMLVRPTMEKVFDMKGSMKDGPNSYRIASLLCVSPIYAVLLTTLGTLAGRHTFFAGMAFKIFRRFIPCSFSRKLVCTPARSKLFK